VGPGSATHHYVLRRVRDTKPLSVPRTLRSAKRCAAEPGPIK
jgi:hypothetical protein